MPKSFQKICANDLLNSYMTFSLHILEQIILNMNSVVYKVIIPNTDD